MIEFKQNGSDLLLIYPDFFYGKPLDQKLREEGHARIGAGGIFMVTEEMLYLDPKLFTEEFKSEMFIFDSEPSTEELDPNYFIFKIGVVSENYYIIEKEVLGIDYELRIHESIPLKNELFVAKRNISIFRRINKFQIKKLTIGDNEQDTLSTEVFYKLLKEFPTTHETNLYANARISSIIRDSLPISVDYEEKFQKYRNKKKSRKGSQPRQIFKKYESDKFSTLIDKIEEMLKNTDPYSENQWQAEILQIIQFLYPKYIKAFKEAPVRDSLVNKKRRIDYLMVDASGYVDAIEIKQPFSECIVTSNCYRGNHVPMRELNGTVMQLEKYIYHLNRWGKRGEDKLNKEYGDQLPSGLKIKIVNPSGMIIMGRDKDLTSAQKNDFEVIRRKYRNVLEIMTYDDMLRRLKIIQSQLT